MSAVAQQKQSARLGGSGHEAAAVLGDCPRAGKAVLSAGEKVAIKKITNVFDHVSDATRILREIKLLRLLRHPGELGRGPGD